MTPDADQPTAASGGRPLEDTQHVDVPRFAPTPDPRPDTRWAWATPGPREASSPTPGSHSPQPTSARPQWGSPSPEAASAWAEPASSATASWAASAAAPTPSGSWDASAAAPTPAWPLEATAAPSAGRRAGPGLGTVAAVALLSAVLASSGTAVALNATGTFDRPAIPAPAANAAAGGGTAGTSGGVVDESSAVISAAAKISPSVVKITTSNASTDPFSGNQTDGVGSGIIYNANGWILTNHHVVTGADTLQVELKDGRTFAGTVYGIDTMTDLAIVKVDATGLPAAGLGSSDALKVGELVVAVGSPLGTYSFSVTSGIVSGKGRSIVLSDGSTISNLIQTDAAINPGNSGGPLADADGNVVGINTAMADGSNGIGFAIPIDIAKPIMAQAVKGETLERPYIGVRFESIDQKVKADQNLTVDTGALIIGDTTTGASGITPGSPAAAAGLQDGDIISAINGIAIDQEHPLNLLIVQFSPNDTVQLTVLRNGQTITVPVTLGVRPSGLQ
jgi:serine protease Do